MLNPDEEKDLMFLQGKVIVPEHFVSEKRPEEGKKDLNEELDVPMHETDKEIEKCENFYSVEDYNDGADPSNAEDETSNTHFVLVKYPTAKRIRYYVEAVIHFL